MHGDGDESSSESEELLCPGYNDRERAAPPAPPRSRSPLPGYRPKKQKRPPPLRDTVLDFSFENPLDGKFKDLGAVKSMLERYPNYVFQRGTSYCHYGRTYRKRTVFVTTIEGFTPTLPCPSRGRGEPGKSQRCQYLLQGGHGAQHERQVTSCRQAEKNSIPEALCLQLLQAWMDQNPDDDLPLEDPRKRKYIVVDCFAGWGSLKHALRVATDCPEGGFWSHDPDDPRWQRIKLFENDLASGRAGGANMELDMSFFGPFTLLSMAIRRFWSLDDSEDPVTWCMQNNARVLFHCSTPCETYSTNGLAVHRKGETMEPASEKAIEHDEMNRKIIRAFEAAILSKRK